MAGVPIGPEHVDAFGLPGGRQAAYGVPHLRLIELLARPCVLRYANARSCLLATPVGELGAGEAPGRRAWLRRGRRWECRRASCERPCGRLRAPPRRSVRWRRGRAGERGACFELDDGVHGAANGALYLRPWALGEPLALLVHTFPAEGGVVLDLREVVVVRSRRVADRVAGSPFTVRSRCGR